MAALTEEQSMIQEQAKTWASEEAPVAKFREMRDSGNELGFDKATWEAIAEIGWAGIIVPETDIMACHALPSRTVGILPSSSLFPHSVL